MVAKCGRCGAEFPGGTVFCSTCGERIVVGFPDGYEDDAPFFAYQSFGETHSYTAAGWTIRNVIPQMIILSFFLVLAVSIGWDALPLVLFAVIVVSAYTVMWMILIHLYRRKGRPLDFGGGGRSVPPSADSAESMERDFPSLSTLSDRDGCDDPGRSYAMSPKRR